MKKYKTPKEAYFSWQGMGLFDLIPGIRDLPYPIRFILMAITVTVVVVLFMFGLAFLGLLVESL